MCLACKNSLLLVVSGNISIEKSVFGRRHIGKPKIQMVRVVDIELGSGHYRETELLVCGRVKSDFQHPRNYICIHKCIQIISAYDYMIIVISQKLTYP